MNPQENFELESVKLYEKCTEEMDFETAIFDEETKEKF